MSQDNKELKEILVKMDTRLDNIDVTLAKQAKDIEHHIKRTDILEQQVAPLATSHQQILGVGKLVTWGGVIIALAIGLKDLALFLMSVD